VGTGSTHGLDPEGGVSPVLFLVLVAALGAVVIGVVLVLIWGSLNVVVRAVLGAALFSLMLLVMIAVRGSLP
jgi:hypothetical protein